MVDWRSAQTSSNCRTRQWGEVNDSKNYALLYRRDNEITVRYNVLLKSFKFDTKINKIAIQTKDMNF